MNLFPKAEIETQTHRGQTYGHREGRAGHGVNWEAWADTHRDPTDPVCRGDD